MRFHDTVRFPRRMKSKQKSRVLPRFYDVPSTEYARLSFFISFRLLLYPSLTILRTPRAILSTNAIRATERGRAREKGGSKNGERVKLPWSKHPGSTLCSSGDAQLLLVRGPGQSRATLNYLPDAIFRREEKLRCGSLLGEISYDRSKTNSSREVQN